MEIIRIIFLLKFVLCKRSSQNVCESLFPGKAETLVIVLRHLRALGESPN